MTVEQSFFIQTLSDFINQRKTEPQENLDWMVISKLSHSHQVDGIIFRQCKEFLSEKDRNAYQQAYGSTVFFYTNLKYEYQKILNLLDMHNVFFFSVKGFHISSFYPVPELRIMSDCDIIIHHPDMASVQSLMCSQGYHGIDNIHAHSWSCWKNSFLFEFHDQLVSSDEHIREIHNKFFNSYDLYVCDHEVESSFHFIFLLMHLRKHFMNSGVGIRQFMDLAVMIKNEPSLDWKWIEEKLIEIQLMPFAKACFFLVRRWFDVDVPFEVPDMDEESFEEVTVKVLGNGVFGKDDPENAGNYEKNVLIRGKGIMWVRRFSLICRMLFPSYQFMKSYPDCGFLDGRPMLLLAAWGKRIWMLCKKQGSRKIRRIFSNSMVSLKAIERQDALLKKMGLP